ncbi:Hpt domain-containing protein [Rapidithrix thailandica]|uniref:Hpt domain-containing protein n=1 Tax=Rapidithrix thailandica TaxID=413964 RepID=A0AAW9SIZ3_9BACT
MDTVKQILNPMQSTQKGLTDFTYLLTLADGDPDFLKEMMGLFLKRVPGNLDELQLATEYSEWEEVYKLTHSLKSSVNFMGIYSIKELVLEVEHMAQERRECEKIPGMVNRIVTVCKQVVEEIRLKKHQLELGELRKEKQVRLNKEETNV